MFTRHRSLQFSLMKWLRREWCLLLHLTAREQASDPTCRGELNSSLHGCSVMMSRVKHMHTQRQKQENISNINLDNGPMLAIIILSNVHVPVHYKEAGSQAQWSTPEAPVFRKQSKKTRSSTTSLRR